MKLLADAVIQKLFYQVLTPRVTTWGKCMRGCGRGARGSGTCRECLAADLATLTGATLAYRLLRAMEEVQQTQFEIEDSTMVPEEF